jgi:hypothetical protein
MRQVMAPRLAISSLSNIVLTLEGRGGPSRRHSSCATVVRGEKTECCVLRL